MHSMHLVETIQLADSSPTCKPKSLQTKKVLAVGLELKPCCDVILFCADCERYFFLGFSPE